MFEFDSTRPNVLTERMSGPTKPLAPNLNDLTPNMK